MSRSTASRLGKLVQGRYPVVRPVVLPYRSGGEPGIGWILRLLDVPDALLCEVEDFAWDRAGEAPGGSGQDFYISAHGSKTSAHFAEAAGRAAKTQAAGVAESPEDAEE